jgi:hypothetical protein
MTARFEEEIGLIKKVIVGFGEGRRSNLAVVSDPFYGESELMDRVEGMIEDVCIRINARSLIRNFEFLDATPKRIVIVEEAHRLYRRKIGGFDAMDRFLNMLHTSDRLFITTWNSASWRYLDEVLGLGRHFPQKISLSKMTEDEIREMLLSDYEEVELTFLGGEEEEALKIFNRAGRKKTLMGHSLEIPYAVVDVRSIKSRLDRSEKKPPEDVFFDKLARISDGNPGVAEHLWKEALDYPKVKDTLRDPASIDLNRDESFALSVVLSMGSIEISYLSEVLEPLDLSAERIASLLEERGFVSWDGEVVAMRAEALKGALEHLRRLRLVW